MSAQDASQSERPVASFGVVDTGGEPQERAPEPLDSEALDEADSASEEVFVEEDPDVAPALEVTDSALPSSDVGPDAAPLCETLQARISADHLSGPLPLTVTFDAAQSCTPVELASVWWSFGSEDAAATGSEAAHTYLASGTYTVTLTLTDVSGQAHATTEVIEVTPGLCPHAKDPVMTGLVSHDELAAPGGLASSLAHPDTLWTHDASGAGSVLYALGTEGQALGALTLAQAEGSVFGDVDTGLDPTSGQPTLYLWDGRDPEGERESVRVVMLPEPSQATLALTPSPELAWTSLALTYPEGVRRDSKALAFDPQTGALLVFARDPDTGSVEVYQKAPPHLVGSTTELTWLAEIALADATPFEASEPTGAAFSPLGDYLLIRFEAEAMLWRRDGGQPLSALFDEAPCEGPFLVETPGGAIAFSADGQGYYALPSERHAALVYSALGDQGGCAAPEARMRVSPLGALYVPLTLDFSVDPTCLDGEVDWVKWSVDGVSLSASSPTVKVQNPGSLEVELSLATQDGSQLTTTRTLELLELPCPWVGPVEIWGNVVDTDINEASGVVMSAFSEGVLWVHNDSGDSARFFAVGEDGSDLGTWTMDTKAKDWEDLAYGFDTELGEPALYLGDVGDNAKSRSDITIYVVPEPEVDQDGGPVTQEVDHWHELTLTYPEGASYNCETVMREPSSGDLYLVAKSSDGQSPVFRKAAPHVDGSETEMEWIAELTFGEAPLSGSKSTTGGAFSPSGDRLIIRTYTHAYLWRLGEESSLADALAEPPCDVEATDEDQGEALCFTSDGQGYITISEGLNQPIHYTPLD